MTCRKYFNILFGLNHGLPHRRSCCMHLNYVVVVCRGVGNAPLFCCDMHTEIPLILRIHLRLFQLIGISNYSLANHPIKRLLGLWSLLLLTFLSVLTVFTVTTDDEFLFNGDGFGHFNDLLKVVFAQVAIAVIYLEAMLRGDGVCAFWQIYLTLSAQRDEAPKTESRFFHVRQHTRFLCIFYFFIAFEAVVNFFFVYLQPKLDRHVMLFVLTFAPYEYVAHLHIMQLVLYMEVLRLELMALVQDLSLLADYTRFAQVVRSFPGFEEFLRHKLREAQITYSRIYEMNRQFQTAFQYSMAFVLLMVYVRVLVDLYFWYFITYREWNQAENLHVIPALFQIPVFMLTSRNCLSVIKHISYQLCTIVSPLHSATLSIQIQNFSLQILHEKIRIEGAGIGPMDGYMLSGVIQSITTYMVFFIQFMPNIQNLDAIGFTNSQLY